MNAVKPTNRRDFLKGTTVAAAGIALAGGLIFPARCMPPAAMN